MVSWPRAHGASKKGTEHFIAQRVTALANIPLTIFLVITIAIYADADHQSVAASAHVGHFKALLSDLKLKKDFKPDIIFVDYLNICASVRYKGAIVNSYTYVKAIAEELRGLAVECSLPIVSATQTTRSGYGNSDPDLTDTSESFGLPATADFMFALISTEELEQQGRILVKQLKNRYSDLVTSRKFMVGIDRAKMKLYDVADDASAIDINQEDPGEDFQQFADTQSRLSKFAEWNV